MLNQKKRQEAMKQFFKNAITSTVDWVKGMGSRVKTGVVAVCIAILSPVGAFAQSLANTGYDAGTSAMEEVATQIAAYVPYVVNLCYALAGVVAIVGAISVYIAMNNEEQDVKNILVLQNWLERIRKEVTNKVLSIKRISDFLIFPILAQPTLKKI
jgi:hypothetical protein